MSLDSLFEQLKHPNPNIRQRASFEIAEQRDEDTIPRLMANLEEEDTVYRRASVKTLGVIGHDSIPYLVESLVKSENATVKASAAKALAQVAINYPDKDFPQVGLDGLRQGVNDENPVVHISSIMALGAIGDSTIELLLEALEKTDNIAVGVTILNTLGGMKDERAKKKLIEFSQDDSVDPYLKETAVSSLSRLEMVSKFARGESV